MTDSSFSSQAILLQSLLMDLQAEMRNKGLWSAQSPAEEAFNSDQPFSVDTMDFSDWLQFVFIRRLQFLIEQQQALPTQCGIAPYAEMVWQNQSSAMREILRILQEIDRTLTEQSEE